MSLLSSPVVYMGMVLQALQRDFKQKATVVAFSDFMPEMLAAETPVILVEHQQTQFVKACANGRECHQHEMQLHVCFGENTPDVQTRLTALTAHLTGYVETTNWSFEQENIAPAMAITHTSHTGPAGSLSWSVDFTQCVFTQMDFFAEEDWSQDPSDDLREVEDLFG